MKTIFLFLTFLPALLFSQNISVDISYSLPRVNETPKQFYAAQFHSAFATPDYERMMQISAKHVTRQLVAGKKVYNYSPAGIGPAFYSSMSVSDCKKMPSSLFSQSPGRFTISGTPDVFTWKSGTAESSRITITPDYRFITGYDSVEVPSRKGDHSDVKAQAIFFHPDNAGLLFFESWNFNPSNGTFTKNIHQCGYMERIDRGAGFYAWTMVADNHDTTGIKKTDQVFMQNIITDVSVMYPEAKILYDSLYSHITGIDAVNELGGEGYGNLPVGERSQFEAALMNYAYSHPEKVFSVSTEGKIDSLHPFTAEKFNSVFEQIDTVFFESPESPGTLVPAPVRTEILLADIYGFRFYEDWYYDPVEMIIKKKVNGIGLLMNHHDPQTGYVTVKDAGLYIKMN